MHISLMTYLFKQYERCAALQNQGDDKLMDFCDKSHGLVSTDKFVASA